MPNSSQIISSIFCARYRKGHFEIFDTAKGMKRIFVYDEPTGGICLPSHSVEIQIPDIFDITFSQRKKVVALLSSQSKGIDYHLFDYVNWKKLKVLKLGENLDPDSKL